MSGTGTGTGRIVTPSPLTYVTVSEAHAYMATRYGAATYWTETVDKTALLATAERDLQAEYGIDTALADGTLATDAVKRCVYEQALFRLRDADGIEARASLRAQGVTAAGIVQEAYGAGGPRVPVCAFARQVLAGCLSDAARSVGQFTLER